MTRSFMFSDSQGGTLRLFVVFAVLAVAAVIMLSAAPAAMAYDFDEDSVRGPSGRSCADCHGREADEATDTVAPTRKGPHGGYQSTTRKCAACHSVHSAPAGGYALLPGPTAKAACESCHDGTGGRGVYGIIKARTGVEEPAAAHRIEDSRSDGMIPNGNPDGTPRAGNFSGPNGTLTCIDCHSPHDSNTVREFRGDRTRAPEGSEEATAGAVPTNRLLRQLVGIDGEPVEYYGSDWCAACHQGYHLAEGGDPTGTPNRHPVGFVQEIDGEARFHYDSVRVVTEYESTETAWGPLGGSNRGYVMPHEPGEVLNHIGEQRGVGPLCQQCHEDARDVGHYIGDSPVLLESQQFRVTGYQGEEETDNPRFQVFPHESDQQGFISERVPEDDPDRSHTNALCMRCHVFEGTSSD